MALRTFLCCGVLILIACQLAGTADGGDGVRGDSLAIREAEAMVGTMGGMDVWAKIGSLHFVHEWYPWYSPESYVENEVLDLTRPRSWVEMKGESYHRVRAQYGPEHGHRSVTNGDIGVPDWAVYDNGTTMY